MDFPKAIRWLLAVFFGYLSLPGNAQINLKTGYNISFLSDDGVNQLIQLFDRPEYSSDFRQLKWLHGFDAGLRYKSDIHALELYYLGGYQSLRASGTTIPDNIDFTDKIKLGVHSGCLGYQLSGGMFGFGAELQYQWYHTKAELTHPDRSFKHVQPMVAYSFYLMLTLSGNRGIDMALKPYVILPDKAYNPDPLLAFNGAEVQLPHDKWTRFGVSLLFYNGGK